MRVDEAEAFGGWPVGQLVRIARTIARRHRLNPIDHDEALGLALLAMVERCHETPAPSVSDLFWTGRHAIEMAAREERRQWGFQRDAPAWSQDQRTDAFTTYWEPDLVGEFEERLVDAIAVRQVYAALPTGQRQALDALVTTGTHAGAAALLGLPLPSYRALLSVTRKRARGYWNYPDAAGTAWSKDVAGRASSARTTMTTIRRRGRDRGSA